MKVPKSIPNFFIDDELLTVLSQVTKRYGINKSEFVEAAIAYQLFSTYGITGFERMFQHQQVPV